MAAYRVGELEQFDPEKGDWPSYSERVEAYFASNDITDPAKQRATFLTVIGPNCYAVLKTLCSPDKPADKPFATLQTLLNNYYEPTRIEIAERFKFYQRKQKDSETVSQFHVAISRLAETCGFGAYLSTAIRDVFVLGLRSQNTQKHLLKERNLTLTSALDLAEAAEAVERDLQKLKVGTNSGAGQIGKVASGYTQRAKGQNKYSKGAPPKPPNRSANSYKHPPSSGSPECHRCGSPSHMAPMCPHLGTKCNKCGRVGHLERKCQDGRRFPSSNKNRAPPRYTYHLGPDSQTYEEGPIYPIYTARGNHPPIDVKMTLNGQKVEMEVDTGASLSLASASTVRDKLPHLKICPTVIHLKDYNHRPIETVGQAMVSVEYMGQQAYLLLIIVKKDRPTLLGRNWLREIRLDWPSILNPHYVHQIPASNSVDLKIQQDFPEVFSPGLGCWKGPPATLHMKAGSIPQFHKPRPVPMALREKVEEAIQDMVDKDVLEPVDYAEWVAPIVPVKKPSGKIRICGDFSVTINPHLEVPQFPMPRTEEVFADMAGGQEFSVLDLSEAFLQIPMDESSQNLLVITTHKGLFRFKRLPFGVASSPAILQKRMDALIRDIPQSSVRVDDIIVTGSTRAQHGANLRKILQRFADLGIKLNPQKCHFFQKEVTYLGHVIDSRGVRPAPTNVQAIRAAATPRSVADVQAFLGMIQYYGPFIPSLATTADPLYNLTRKNVKFEWSEECDKAFASLKRHLTSPQLLVHYRQSLPLVVQCDASPVGVGAVLSHIMPDNSERPIAFASQTLDAAQKKYAQIEKEAFSLVFGVSKFHQYLFGRHFILRTDHKPLVHIFSPKSGIPAMAANRLQRWAYLLKGYDFEIQHVPGSKNGNADALSRLPIAEVGGNWEMEDFSILSSFAEQDLPMNFSVVAAETVKDRTLSKVLEYVQSGWPAKLHSAEKGLQPFFPRRYDMSTDSGCLFMGDSLVVPGQLQKTVLGHLHSGHPGITRMRLRARGKMWWPGLDSQIVSLCQQCPGCNETANARPDPSVHNHWPTPSEPWERLHLDFAGPIKDTWYLIAVDAASNCPEICAMKQATSQGTISFLRSVFSRMGLPRTLVTDNGSQFTSQEFKLFCHKNGITHLCTAPGHPSSNGEAERMVQNLKKALKAMAEEKGDQLTKLHRFLFSYRSTPSATSRKSPAEQLFGRPLRSRLDQLRPWKKFPEASENASRPLPKTAQFAVGSDVWVKNLVPGSTPKWLPGTVISQESNAIYRVSIRNAVYRRHFSHLRPRKSGSSVDLPAEWDDDWDIIPTIPPAPDPAPIAPQPRDPPPDQRPDRRYPDRQRRAVDRMGF